MQLQDIQLTKKLVATVTDAKTRKTRKKKKPKKQKEQKKIDPIHNYNMVLAILITITRMDIC